MWVVCFIFISNFGGYLQTDEIYPYDENELRPSQTEIVIEYETISVKFKYYGGYDSFTFNTDNDFEITIHGTIIFDIIDNMQDTTSKILSDLQECPQNEIPIESVNITTTAQDNSTDIFYTASSEVKTSYVLNWCNYNNPLRPTINTFTNVVGLPNDNIINDLLTYWLSITIIYIVIDIIIEIAIYLTHFFNKEV